MLLFGWGRNGFGGYGNGFGGNSCGCSPCATQADVRSAVDQQTLISKIDQQTYGIADIFPALQKYKDEHNTANLQKLMVEILEFCLSVYASTRSEDERKIYHSMIEKLNK